MNPNYTSLNSLNFEPKIKTERKEEGKKKTVLLFEYVIVCSNETNEKIRKKGKKEYM